MLRTPADCGYRQLDWRFAAECERFALGTLCRGTVSSELKAHRPTPLNSLAA